MCGGGGGGGLVGAVMRGRKSVLVSFKLSGESGIRGKSLTKNKQSSTLVSGTTES